MMLKFRNLLYFPSFYSKRNSSVRHVVISISNIKKEEDYTEIEGISKDYTPIIRIFGDVDIDSYVSISCTCESFIFEFAHAVNSIKSLIDPQKFGEAILKKPLDKNKYIVPSGCKHIISLANLITKEKSWLK